MKTFFAFLLIASICGYAAAPSLFVYCAAGMRLPVETIAREFEKQSGTRVELTYDGTNKLLGQIKLTRKGDVYIAGDADYIGMARKEGLADSSRTVCYFVPVIMVKKGNPLKIRALPDLTAKGIKIGQADDKAAAVGRLMPKILALNGVDSLAWKINVKVTTPTVNELGIAIKLATIDAAVVWSAIAASYADVSEMVALPIEKNVTPEVGAAVLRFTRDRDSASRFLDFLVSPAARAILAANGYAVEKPVK